MKMDIEIVASELRLDRSNWSLTTFGEVAIQQKESVDRENTDITRYIKGEHMHSEDLHLREWGELKDEYLGPAFIRKFDEGDILYGSRRTYLRKVCIAPFEGITANTTFVIKANEDLIDKCLLPFVMLSEGFSEHSIRNSKGSVNPYVNWKDLAGYEFLLPPKDQQAQLVELLCMMDETIEKELVLIEALKTNKNVLLENFILDKSTRDVATFGEIGKWVSGGTPSKKEKSFWDNGETLWVTPKDMKSDVLRDSLDKLANKAITDGKAKLFEQGSTVLVWRSGILQHTFPIARVSKDFTVNQDMKVFQPTKSAFLSEYVRVFLTVYREKIRRECVKEGTTVQSVNTDVFMKQTIPILALPLQKEIIALDEKCHNALMESAEHLNRSKYLQKSLINQVF